MTWTLNFNNTELILISLGIFALGSLLIYVGYKVIDVMIFPTDSDDD